jgi:hypothetical protein
MLVGGVIWANNNTSTGTPMRQSSWGDTGPETTVIKSAFVGYGWSPEYNEKSYLSRDLYMRKKSLSSYPIGGRYYSSNSKSDAAKVTESFWGFSDGVEVGLFGGYNQSDPYKSGYGYATIVLSK